MQHLISILGADIRNDRGVWRTNDLTMLDGDPANIIDSLRVAAAAVLAGQDPAATLLVQGGWAGYQDPGRPSMASVMQRELQELSVAPERILLDEESQKTIPQLLFLQDVAVRENVAQVTILTNGWHLPRVAALLEHHPALKPLRDKQPRLVAAEEVLLKDSPEAWTEKIQHAAAHPLMKEIIADEERGIEQLHSGTYRF